jgi:hypothetical protein
MNDYDWVKKMLELNNIPFHVRSNGITPTILINFGDDGKAEGNDDDRGASSGYSIKRIERAPGKKGESSSGKGRAVRKTGKGVRGRTAADSGDE